MVITLAMFGILITRSKFIPTTEFQDEHIIMFEIMIYSILSAKIKTYRNYEKSIT